jgi:hypothetical protein
MTTRRFAEGTEVSSEKTKMEIERTLARYGATSFASAWNGNVAVLVFEAHGRRVKFSLAMPQAGKTRGGKYNYVMNEAACEAERRRLWRCLGLAIKAKLEVVESGIATFEQEFLAHIVLPHGATVGDWAAPELEKVYRTGAMLPLLTSGGPR